MSSSSRSQEVVVAVYDLSNGLASQLSQSILGTHIPAIFHTGVRVHGSEYFYGGGIQRAPAGMTPYGVPMRLDTVGNTSKSPAELAAFLHSIRHDFSMMRYHLLDHNCNHFSQACVQFLVPGASVANDVMSLVDTVRASPMAALVIPFIESMHKQAGIGTDGAFVDAGSSTAVHPSNTNGSANVNGQQQQGSSSTGTSQQDDTGSRSIGTPAEKKYRKKLADNMIKLTSGNRDLIINKLNQTLLSSTSTSTTSATTSTDAPLPKQVAHATLTYESLCTLCRAQDPAIAFPSLDLLRLAIVHDWTYSPPASSPPPELSVLLAQHVAGGSDLRVVLMALRVAVNAVARWPAAAADGTVSDALDCVLGNNQKQAPSDKAYKTAVFALRNVAAALPSLTDCEELLTRVLYIVTECFARMSDDTAQTKSQSKDEVVVLTLVESCAVCVEADPAASADLLAAYGFDVDAIETAHAARSTEIRECLADLKRMLG